MSLPRVSPVGSPGWVLAAAVALLGACGGDDGGGDEAAATTGADDGGGSTLLPGTGDATDGDAESSDDAVLDESGDDGPTFGECLLWGDDCSNEGQKCMPWSLLPDRIPDETRCCPVQDNPALENEECTVEEYDGSCRDSCEQGTMCVVDSLETLSGVCRKFCDPSSSACDPDDTCKPFFELIDSAPEVPLCMDKCDPLVQDCVQPGWLCLPDSPTVAGQSGFICTPPGPGTLNGVLTACGLANDCQEGLVCIVNDRLPVDCGYPTCCSAICGLSEGNGPCQEIHPDLACVDWMSPDPEWQDVGVCALAE